MAIIQTNDGDDVGGGDGDVDGDDDDGDDREDGKELFTLRSMCYEP